MMPNRPLILASALLLIALASDTVIPSRAAAQEPPRMSQHGTVSQTITGTTITVEYDRPTARGRDLKEADVIHFGRFWTPGANWATTLEIDGPVKIEGQDLAPGKYSMWMIPRDEAWTVILSADHRVFHTRTPDETKEVLRFDVEAIGGHDVDALQFYFPEVTGHRTTLNFHWGTFIIPMHLEVTPWPMAEVTAEQRAVYTGTYEGPEGAELVIDEEDDILVIKGLPFMEGGTLQLIPKGHHTYQYGVIMDGELREVWIPTLEMVFIVEDGQATSFEVWQRGAMRSTHARR